MFPPGTYALQISVADAILSALHHQQDTTSFARLNMGYIITSLRNLI